MITALRDATIQALLMTLRLMIPVTAVGAVAVVIALYTLVCAAGFYGVAWLVHAALSLLLTTA